MLIARRRGSAKCAIAIMLFRSLVGCHSYAPQSSVPRGVGTPVRVRFARPQRLIVRVGSDSTIRTATTVTGRIQSVDGDSIHLFDLGTIQGGASDGREISASRWPEATVALPVAGSDVAVKRIAPMRTALVTGVVVVSLALLLAALAMHEAHVSTSY